MRAVGWPRPDSPASQGSKTGTPAGTSARLAGARPGVWRRYIRVRHWLRLSAGVIVLIAVIALWVGQGSIHPKLTRQQAIHAAMKYGDHQPYPRVEAKYMRYSDLVAGGEAISGGSDISCGSLPSRGSTQFLPWGAW